LLDPKGVTTGNCPLCGTSVALIRRPERRSYAEVFRARIATLRERAAQLARGDITPRALKDDALWMCAGCQGIMVGGPRLDGLEVQRRIHEEVRQMKNDGATTTIIVEGTRNNVFARRVRARIAQALSRVDPPPTTAKAIFADENGPKGGPGIRCTIVHDMPRRRDFSVSEYGDTEQLAFDAAFDALETSVGRDRARRRELVRRPKKYFLAKRLLAADASPAVPEGARPKRARRRRVA
jgi:hypothetical protein